MRVALLGGSGHVAKYMIDELRAHDIEVNLLSRRELPSRPGTTRFKGDARELSSVERVVRGCDAMVNCVGQLKNEADFYATVTRNVLAAMEVCGVRRYILVTSTVASFAGDVPTVQKRLGALVFRLFFPRMLKDKETEALIVARSEVDWTVFRLPLVRDKLRADSAAISANRLGGLMVYNSQVARAVVREILSPENVRSAPFLFHTSRSPLSGRRFP